jgi:uncharacterized protein (TIGR02246 family)
MTESSANPLAAACLLALTLAACQSRSPDPQEASEAVMKAEREWAAAAQARDLERSVAFMADDAMMFPPGAAPIVGKAAIREYMAGAFATPGFSVTWEPAAVVIAEAGDLAYTHGRSTYTVPGSDGQIVTIHAKGVAIWRKDAQGVWRCIIDIWNDAPAPELQSHAVEAR